MRKGGKSAGTEKKCGKNGSLDFIQNVLIMLEKDCRNMEDNGYSLIRIIVWWELVEERKGEYDFSFVDSFFRRASREN